MGGIGNAVVNAVVRTLTRKAVGKAMKSAKAAGGKKRKSGRRRRFREGQTKRRSVSLPGAAKRGGSRVGFR
jgi:hypothetical protein